MQLYSLSVKAKMHGTPAKQAEHASARLHVQQRDEGFTQSKYAIRYGSRGDPVNMQLAHISIGIDHVVRLRSHEYNDLSHAGAAGV